MSNISKNTEQKYLLNGVEYNAPIEWSDTTIEANYIDDSIQPSIEVSDFIFPLEAKKAVNDWFNGPIGGFEGMPIELILYNNQSTQVSFKALLDFYSNYEELNDDGRVNVGILKEDSIDELYSKLEALTFGYLEEIKSVVPGDYTNVDYVVEKKFNLFEIVIASIMFFLMAKALYEQILNTADAIGKLSTSTIPVLGVGATGPVISVNTPAIVFAALNLTIQIIYTAALLLAIVQLAKDLFSSLVSPKRKHKAILLKTALLKVADHLGYGLVIPDELFNDAYYLPSNPRLDEKGLDGFIKKTKGTPSGIPNVLDYGYGCAEIFNLAKTLIRGKIAIIGNDIHIRPMKDPFWIQQSVWSLPNYLIKSKKYNLSDLKSTRTYQFKTDINDEWTIDNYKGNAYEVRTDPKTIINKKNVLLKGLEETNFNVSLPTRKDELNYIEKYLSTLGGFIDEVTGLLGKGTDFKSSIESKIGVLKQSENNHSIPKLLILKGGKLPKNHRDLLSAKLLYNNYHNYDSFVGNSFKKQRAIYEGVEIPFGLEDFKQLSKNPYFFFEGNQAKIINFTWNIGSDRAVISFWSEEVYTKNLKETFIEAE